MSTCTGSLVDVTDYIYDLLTANKTGLGVQDVWYGDQKKLPKTPALCVEPGTKERQLVGAPRQAQVILKVYVIAYSTSVRDEQVNRLEADEIAEGVENLLHSDAQMGGLVVHSMVTAFESGYVVRGAGLVRACRVTFSMLSKTLLPYTGSP
jgi:hypothetical protein